MHRPSEGPFEGSMPMPVEGEIGARLAGRIGAAMGALAVLAAGGVWVAACTVVEAPDVPTVLKLSCLAMLVVAAVGLWLVRQAEAAPRLSLATIYEGALRRVSWGDRVAVRGTAPAEGQGGVSGLLGELALLARRLHAGRARDAATLDQAGRALSDGRAQARQLASRIMQDAACLAETAARVDADSGRLGEEIVAASQAFELTEDAVSRALEGVAELAGAVRGTTASAERMTGLVIQLSKVAQDTQRSVADLDDRSARLALALDQVAETLQQVGQASDALARAPAGGGAASHPTDVAADIHRLATGCKDSLREATVILHELMTNAGDAIRRTIEIGELIRSNHEVGYAISRAVQQQGQDIAGLLLQIYEGRSGFAALRAGVDAIGRAGSSQLGAMVRVRETAQRLPGHADAVADILRGLPDFAPGPKE